jgi:hypothetical protein
MSLIDVHSAATAGTAEALIAAEATRTSNLLMIELHRASCCEENTVVRLCLLLHASRSEYGCGCAR